MFVRIGEFFFIFFNPSLMTYLIFYCVGII
nr:MAG TPA: hypothetical protein [Herelleviridae sp.]